MSGDRLDAFRDPTEPVEEPAPSLVERWAENILSGPAILDGISPVRWKVPGLVPADMVTAIYGPPKSGKSYVALTLGLELARGGFWNGRRLDRTSVLYVAAERPSDIRDRLDGWQRFHGEKVPGAFHLWPREFPQISTPGIWAPLAEFTNSIGAEVVILDTFARVTTGVEENSSKDIGPVMENLERLAQATNGGAVIFVHHSGKDTDRGMRGSSAILGAVSSGLAVTGSDGYIRVTLKDSNVGPDGATFDYRLEPVELDPAPGETEIRSTVVLVAGSRPPTSAEDLDRVLELLRDSFHGEATRRQLWHAFRESTGRDPSEQTVGKWLTALGKDHRVEKIGNGRATRWRLPESAPEEIPGT